MKLMVETRAPAAHPDPDQRVTLHDVSWEGYEAILAIRGESSGVRITYLEGELELMTPSRYHERVKTLIARLVEVYAMERDLDLNGYGSWTIWERPRRRGAEADECYVLGSHEPKRPDLAIEVVWTSGGIDKLEVWRGLSVPEVWIWEDSRIQVHLLDGTFFANGEIPGRDMSEIPHPFIEESLARFAPLPASERAKVRFTHLNHTNPATDPEGEAQRQIEAAGMSVAAEVEIITLRDRVLSPRRVTRKAQP